MQDEVNLGTGEHRYQVKWKWTALPDEPRQPELKSLQNIEKLYIG